MKNNSVNRSWSTRVSTVSVDAEFIHAEDLFGDTSLSIEEKVTKIKEKIGAYAAQMKEAGSQNKQYLIAGHEDILDSILTVEEYQLYIDTIQGLSRDFPDIIFAPGSVYVQTKLDSPVTINQDGENIQNVSYLMKNVSPIFQNGQLVNFEVKGEKLLKKKAGNRKKEIIEDERGIVPGQDLKYICNRYAEDELISELQDSNGNIVPFLFAGTTKVSFEKEGISPDQCTPVFEVDSPNGTKLKMMVTICGDHRHLASDGKGDKEIDIYLLQSNGQALQVQQDLKSDNISCAICQIHADAEGYKPEKDVAIKSKIFSKEQYQSTELGL